MMTIYVLINDNNDGEIVDSCDAICLDDAYNQFADEWAMVGYSIEEGEE